MTRRQVGGYAWQEELSHIRELSDTVRGDLLKLMPQARTVETATQLAHLVAACAEISTSAMELKEYDRKGGA